MAYSKEWRTEMPDGTIVTRSNTWSPPGSHPVGYGVKVVTKDGKLVHESGDFTVRYNFFAENGDAGFWFINNSDSVVFLNLAESFFILNGHANDYYQARGWTTTKSSTITISKQERKNKKKAQNT